jgi:hypothetical protein
MDCMREQTSLTTDMGAVTGGVTGGVTGEVTKKANKPKKVRVADGAKAPRKAAPKKKKSRRRRPLKRTAMDKLQLRQIEYKKRLDINTFRMQTLEKKLDSIDHELLCRLEEAQEQSTENNNPGE